jgi:hypothetical protein
LVRAERIEIKEVLNTIITHPKFVDQSGGDEILETQDKSNIPTGPQNTVD